MKDFVQLYRRIDSTTRIIPKVQALVDYFQQADKQEAIWVAALFTHRRPRRLISTSLLRQWAMEAAGLQQWLFEDAYHICGDLAETIALVVPEPSSYEDYGLDHYFRQMLHLKGQDEEIIKSWVLDRWAHLDQNARFLFNKFITGGFRIGVSAKLLTRALAKAFDKDEAEMAYSLMGNWSPYDTDLQALIKSSTSGENLSKPYPFYLAYALEKELEELGDPEEWSIEYKWDGIRSQLIKRSGEWFLWSRGEELINESFPEFEQLLALPDGTVIDGELLAYQDDLPLDFNHLQKRLGRKKPSKKMISAVPCIIMAYDLLEYDGQDIRDQAYAKRRSLLHELITGLNHPLLKMSASLKFDRWKTAAHLRESARAQKAEGLMLKMLNSDYKVGRKKGDWWKYKVDPYTIDAVMTYAQSGHGRRSNLFTDYTFGLWQDGELVTFAKAYSGLTDEEFAEVSRYVRANTLERFGPVRRVKAELVFELAFEGIHLSSRHKSGIAVRFPRIKRWRKDKKASEADSLDNLKKLIGE